MKKCISIFLVVLLALTCVFPVVATNQSTYADFYVRVRLVSTFSDGVWSSLDNRFGHTFIVVYNESNVDIKVGHMTVEPDDAVTVGFYGNRSTYKGVWYNIEGYAQPTDSFSIECAISASQLKTINNIINSPGTYKATTNNCSHFAVKIWNSVASVEEQVSGGFPDAVSSSIAGLDNYDTDISIPRKSLSSIAYQTATGVKYEPKGANKH